MVKQDEIICYLSIADVHYGNPVPTVIMIVTAKFMLLIRVFLCSHKVSISYMELWFESRIDFTVFEITR